MPTRTSDSDPLRIADLPVAEATMPIAGKIEAAIEAPFIGGKVAVGVLGIARTAGAEDGVLDLAELLLDHDREPVIVEG